MNRTGDGLWSSGAGDMCGVASATGVSVEGVWGSCSALDGLGWGHLVLKG